MSSAIAQSRLLPDCAAKAGGRGGLLLVGAARLGGGGAGVHVRRRREEEGRGAVAAAAARAPTGHEEARVGRDSGNCDARTRQLEITIEAMRGSGRLMFLSLAARRY